MTSEKIKELKAKEEELYRAYVSARDNNVYGYAPKEAEAYEKAHIEWREAYKKYLGL